MATEQENWIVPRGPGVDRKGNKVYVAELGNLRLQEFNPSGTYVAAGSNYPPGNQPFFYPA